MAVMCGFCFPYLSSKDVEQFIRDVSRLLKAEGILYLSTMEGEYDKSGFQTSSSGDQVCVHYHLAEFIARLLKANGFEVIDTERKAFDFDEATPVTDLFIYAKKSY
jgi:predicted TPR repeat methyltransferase